MELCRQETPNVLGRVCNTDGLPLRVLRLAPYIVPQPPSTNSYASDMASADLAVGLIGLFSVCLEGYRLISSAEGYARDALVLRTQLCIEEQRLKNWGHVWGFVPSDHYRPESRRRLYHQHVGNMGCAALVEEMLKRIGMLLEEAEKLGAKYGLVPAAGLNTMAEASTYSPGT